MTESVETSRQNSAGGSQSSGAPTGHRVGYARVSTKDQVLDRQIDALTADGCVKVFTDHGVSGTKIRRPGLDAALDYMRPGDVFVVQSLDRLSRRTNELLGLVEDLEQRGVGFRVVNFPDIDTTGPFGKAILTIMAALAQMERDVLAERVRDGLQAARERGRTGGRPPSLTSQQIETAVRLRGEGKPYRQIAASIGSTEATVRRVIKATVPIEASGVQEGSALADHAVGDDQAVADQRQVQGTS